jgi:hypothetical protein
MGRSSETVIGHAEVTGGTLRAVVVAPGAERFIAVESAGTGVTVKGLHGFHNASKESATLLVMHHPAGFEQFLDEMQELVARHGSKEERIRLAARFDMIPVPAAAET